MRKTSKNYKEILSIAYHPTPPQESRVNGTVATHKFLIILTLSSKILKPDHDSSSLLDANLKPGNHSNYMIDGKNITSQCLI